MRPSQLWGLAVSLGMDYRTSVGCAQLATAGEPAGQLKGAPEELTIFGMATLLINIDVPDLEHGIRFYTAAFDLRLGRRLGSDFAELLGAEAPIYLLENVAGTSPFREAEVTRHYSRHWTPLHLDFVVSDIQAALTRALAAGARQESDVTEHSYGRLVLLSDPFGHGECLLQFNTEGYDAIATSS